MVSDDHGRERVGKMHYAPERPEHKERVLSFIEKLKEFQERTSDPWLHKWTYE